MPHSPVFIVGVPRSGTTLVSMLLNGHSAISIPPETHYFEKFYRQGQRRGCLTSDSAYRAFVHYVLGSPNLAAFHFSDAERTQLFERIASTPTRSHATVLATILSAYAERQGKARWGEKTPKHMHALGDIWQTFPTARVVLVLRDPRDVVLSLRQVNWEPGNMIEHLRQWRAAARYAATYAASHADRFMVLRYEDLLNEASAVTERLCRFLGLRFEPAMLAYYKHADANFDLAAEPWKAKNLHPIDPSNQMKWRHQMQLWEQALTAAEVGADMDRWGYPAGAEQGRAEVVLRRGYLYAENAVMLGRHWCTRAWLRLQSTY